MKSLTPEIQAFIVMRLACHDAPSEVARAVAEEFDIKITRQHVQKYDPTRTGKKPAKRWVTLFDEERARFMGSLSDIPEAHTVVRVRRLALMATRAEGKGNLPLAAQLYEQIAKEVGDAFTNRHELTGKNGAPLVPDRSLEDCSFAELATMLLAGLTDTERSAVADTLSHPRAADTGAEKARATEGRRNGA